MKETVIWICVAMMLMTACQHEESSDIQKPESKPSAAVAPKVDNQLVQLKNDDMQFNVSIESRDSWKIESDVNWLRPDKSNGNGNDKVIVNCPKNTTKQRREGKLTVTSLANHLKATVTVRQAGLPLDTAKLLGYRAISGNYMKDEKSYIEMTFDKPMKVESVLFDLYSIDPLSPEYSEDRCTVRYVFPAASYGLDALATVIVVSDDGVKSKYDILFAFYDKHYLVEGEIRAAKVSPSEESVWISMSRPSKLIEMSLADGSILHETDMPFTPGRISINPYNGLLYVMPFNFQGDLGYDNRFCVVDPTNGSITKTITIDPSAKTHPQDPAIYPYELEFTRDGFGILMLHQKGGVDLREWRYVDSADDDKITVTEYRWPDYWFEHVYQGCNEQSLYSNTYYAVFHEIYQMTRQHPEPKLYQLHSSFNSTYEYAGGVMATMLYHRYRNSVFIATAPACQCVVDLDNLSYSEVTDAEARGGVKAAWDYSDPSRNLVYYVGGVDKKFLLLDMDIADCLYFNRCYLTELCTVDHLVKSNQVLMTDLYQGVYIVSADGMK